MLTFTCAALSAWLWPTPLLAGPQGAKTVSGNVKIFTRGSTTIIRASNNSIIDFSSFDIASGQTVKIIEPSAQARVLEDVLGASPTIIDGTLKSNGGVFLVNANGIIFGTGSVVQVGSLTAVAGQISNADFLSGVNHFTDVNGSVINNGRITAGQNVSLIGQSVTNNGSVTAGGAAVFASGNDVFVNDDGGDIYAKVAPKADSLAVETDGSADVYALALGRSSSVKAAQIVANGAGSVNVSGTLDASSSTPGATGGSVTVTGNSVALSGATVNASGPAGGGTVLIGGGSRGQDPNVANSQSTTISSDTTITDSALANGNGGQVVVWSDGTTNFAGQIAARGGPLGGNGGSAEVSGENLVISLALGEIDLTAPAGETGTLLLDPASVEIEHAATADDTEVVTGTNTGSVVTDADINSALLTANVTITTANDGTNGASDTLSVDGTTGGANGAVTISWSNANSLTLVSTGAMTLNAGSTIDASGGGVLAGSLTMKSPTIDILGTVTVGGTLTLADASGGMTGAAIFDTGSVITAGTLLNMGSTTINATTAVQTLGGGQTYTGPVTIGAAVSLDDNTTVTTTGNITFDSTVDGGFGLTVATLGTTDFKGAVGGVTQLTSLTSGLTSGAGTKFTMAAGGAVHTAGVNVTGAVTVNDFVTFDSGAPTTVQTGGGGQSYAANATLSLPTVLADSGTTGGDFTFTGTINGDEALTVATKGTTNFEELIGGTTPIASLTSGVTGGNGTEFTMTVGASGAGVNVAGPVTVNDPVTFEVGSSTALIPSVQSTAGQTYAGAATVSAAAFLTDTASGDIKFESTINDTTNGTFGLTVATSGTTTFEGVIGGTTQLASLTSGNTGGLGTTFSMTAGVGTTPAAVNVTGAVLVNDPVTFHVSGSTISAPSVETNGGGQTYNAGVTLGDPTVLSDIGAGSVTLQGNVTAASAEPLTLNVGSSGTLTFAGINTDGGAISLIGGTVDQTTGAIVAGTSALSFMTNTLTLGGSIGGTGSVSVKPDTNTFSVVFGTTPAASTLLINAADLTALTTGSTGPFIVQAPGGTSNITLSTGITAAFTNATNNLVFQAGNNVVIQGALSTAGGTIQLEANSPGLTPSSTGVLTISGAGSIASGGGNITLIGTGFVDTSSTTPSIVAGAGSTVTFAPASATAFTLATSGGTLNPALLSAADLTAGLVIIGQATTDGTNGLGASAQTITADGIAINNNITDASLNLELVTAGIVDSTGLFSGGGVTQAQAAPITVSQLLLEGSGTFTLNSTGNTVATLATNTTGSVTLDDSSALTIGTVNGVAGATVDPTTATMGTPNATASMPNTLTLDLTVATDNPLTVSEPINTDNGSFSLTVAGNEEITPAIASDITAPTAITINAGGATGLTIDATAVLNSASITLQAPGTATSTVTVANGTLDGPTAGTSPTSVTIEQGEGFSDAPSAGIYGADIPVNLTLISDDGSITLVNPGNFDNAASTTNLTLTASATPQTVTLPDLTGLTLGSLNITAGDGILGGGGINLGGNVTTTGSQFYNDPVTLALTAQTFTSGTEVNFAKNIIGGVVGTPTVVTINAPIIGLGPLSNASVATTATVTTVDIHAGESIDVGLALLASGGTLNIDPATYTDDVVFTLPVTVVNTSGIAGGFVIADTWTSQAAGMNPAPTVTMEGAFAASTTTPGNGFTFAGPVILGPSDSQNQVQLKTTGGSNIVFESTLDAQTLGGESLLLNTANTGAGNGGNVQFDATVGGVNGVTALASISTQSGAGSGMGTTTGQVLFGADTGSTPETVTTTAGQTYGSPVVLEQNTTLVSTGTGSTAGGVAFSSTVDGATSGGQSLTVNASYTFTGGNANGSGGNIQFGAGKPQVLVGGMKTLASLTTTSNPAMGGTGNAGATIFGSATNDVSPTIVNTAGAQTYNNPVELNQDTVFTTSNLASDANPGNVTFESVVDSGTAGPFSLTVNSMHAAVTFDGDLGDVIALSATANTTNLNNLTVTSGGGPTTLSGSVTADGNILFNENLVLTSGSTPTITGMGNSNNTPATTSNVTFDGTISGAGALSVDADGQITFAQAVGTPTPLTSLNVTNVAGNTGAIAIDANVTTTGPQTYLLSTAINGGTIALTSTSSTITFGNTSVTEPLALTGNITLNDTGTTFNGTVTGTGSLKTDSSATAGKFFVKPAAYTGLFESTDDANATLFTRFGLFPDGARNSQLATVFSTDVELAIPNPTPSAPLALPGQTTALEALGIYVKSDQEVQDELAVEPVEAVVYDDTPQALNPSPDDLRISPQRLDQRKVQALVAEAGDVFGPNFPYRQGVTAMLQAEIADFRAKSGAADQKVSASQFATFALTHQDTADEQAFAQKLAGLQALRGGVDGIGISRAESDSANQWWTTRITPQDANLVDDSGSYDPHWLLHVLNALPGAPGRP